LLYKEFLENKPLFYDEIDYQRMPRIWQKIKSNFKIGKIIHIVGTNAKGSTGRFIAWYLYKSGLKVGHYSSPHILNFNERIWYNGKDIDDSSLQEAHKYLSDILETDDLESLSYFEYTTLMAVYILQDCDYIVLEAGLGGEFDATQVFKKYLSVITPIGYDHQEFLGNNIKDIALTKLRSIQKKAIVSKQPYDEVFQITERLSKSKDLEIQFYKNLINNEDIKSVESFAQRKNIPNFLKDNLLLSISVLKYLDFKIDINYFDDLILFGRCQKVSKNITIDVGHNILAAKALRKSFEGSKIILIYNTYKDKDYKEILNILKPVIERVEILPVDSKRIENISIIKQSIKDIKLKVKIFEKIDSKKEYLVFGSFSVVEEFLRKFA